jgi:hypothetical protein
MRVGDQITVLEGSLKELIRLWERFFAGDVKVPPQSQREQLQRRLRQLSDGAHIIRSADRFRLEQLQHRFMTYAMNWERMLREREEGRGRSMAVIRATARAGQPSPPPATNGRAAAAVHSGGGDDLFERYRSAKEDLGQKSGLDRVAFEKQISSQRSTLEAKLGREVSFDVKVADGKVKLVVKKNGSSKK